MLKHILSTAFFFFATHCLTAQYSICYSYTYNEANLIVQEHGSHSMGAAIDIYRTYDARGRETEMKQIDSASGTTQLLVQTTWYDRPCAYDKKTLTISYTNPAGPDSFFHYLTFNSHGKVILDSMAHNGPFSRTVYTYEDTLLTSEISHALGADPHLLSTILYRYNESKQLARKTYTHFKGISSIYYTYDKQGRLIEEQKMRREDTGKEDDLGKIAEYKYSKTGQLVTKFQSGKASDSSFLIASTTSYQYDAQGRLSAMCTVYSLE
jgi:hypothetical protein